MSVGDIKGSRRRIKILKAKGHYPVAHNYSIAEAITRNRIVAARMAKASGAKK